MYIIIRIMYSCEICNYFYEARTAIYTHNKSKKHIQNLEDYNNKIKEIDEMKIIQIKNKEINELKQKLIETENQKKEFELKANIYKEISEKPKSINNSIITNNINYLIKNYNKAPPLEKISNFVINEIDIDDDNQRDKIVEILMYHYKNKSLHKLIGDHIVKNYKKDDIRLQSFHTTDVARCNYLIKLHENLGYIYDDSSDDIDYYNPEDNIIREKEKEYNISKGDSNKLINVINVNKKISNKSSWRKDSGGKKVSYLLFDPIIRKMVNQLKKKCRDYNIILFKNTKTIPTTEDIEKFKLLSSIIKDIDADKIKNNINKYIAPYFDLDKNPKITL